MKMTRILGGSPPNKYENGGNGPVKSSIIISWFPKWGYPQIMHL